MSNHSNCPLCGSNVVYYGLNSLECSGSGCKNNPKPFNWMEAFREALYRSNEEQIQNLQKLVQNGSLNQHNYRLHPAVIRLLDSTDD